MTAQENKANSATPPDFLRAGLSAMADESLRAQVGVQALDINTPERTAVPTRHEDYASYLAYKLSPGHRISA